MFIFIYFFPGITCLFISAKIEEIYPRNLSEFAYVTDGACLENEILEKELVILKVSQCVEVICITYLSSPIIISLLFITDQSLPMIIS